MDLAWLLVVGVIGAAVLGRPLWRVLEEGRQYRRQLRACQAIPRRDFEAMLDALDAFSPSLTTAFLLVDVGPTRPADAPGDGARDAPHRSKIGGLPYIEDVDAERMKERALPFLLQLEIPPELERSPLCGNLLVLFGKRGDVECLNYAAASPTRHSVQATAFTNGVERQLRTVRVPRVPHGERRHRNVYDPNLLLKTVPGLAEIVARAASVERIGVDVEPSLVLSRALCPEATWDVDAFTRIQVGGSPQWIQGPETPRCDACGRQQTFVAQIGVAASEPLRRARPADVLYLFTCPKHRETVSCVGQFD